MTTIYYFKKVVNFLLTMRGIASVLFAIAFAALAFALTAEHLWSVKPCVLCTYQRYVFVVLMGAAVLGFFFQSASILFYLYTYRSDGFFPLWVPRRR